MLIPTLHSTVPLIKELPECADFSKTVAPYIPQLYALPQQLFQRINDRQGLQHLYLSTNPAITSFAFAIYFVAPVALIAAEVNKNYSQIDRVWSILPVIYNCHYAIWAHMSGLPTSRLDHVMALSMLWGARLTFNYWRKGGYSIGSEDYRWVVVRKYAGSWMFLFNLLFISFGQSLLLFLITTPTYILLLCSRLLGNDLTMYDQFFSKFIFLLIVLEFFADQQQWDFHQAKAKYQATAKAPKEYAYTAEQLDRGFNTSGLWGWSRHPNFAAEQAVWVCLYQWSCCESFTFVNWAFTGAMGYLLLFQASTWFTELITAEKYPMYKVYQERVGKFLPQRKTRSMDELEKVGEKEKEIDAPAEGKSTGSIGKGKGKGKGKKK